MRIKKTGGLLRAVAMAICVTGGAGLVPPLRAADDVPPATHPTDARPAATHPAAHTTAEPATQPAPRVRPAQAAPRVSLHREMEGMDRALKALRGQIKDPAQTASSVALVNELQARTAAAKTVLPGSVATRPANERTEMASNYHRMMLGLLRAELDIEDQLLDGKNDKAADLLTGIHDMEAAGHSEFIVKD